MELAIIYKHVLRVAHKSLTRIPGVTHKGGLVLAENSTSRLSSPKHDPTRDISHFCRVSGLAAFLIPVITADRHNFIVPW